VAPPLPFLTSFPAVADVEKLLKASGSEVDTEKLTVLLKALEGKKLHELIAAGTQKLSSVCASSAGPAATGGAAAAVAEEEAKPKEEAEVADMGDLFGDDDDDY